MELKNTDKDYQHWLEQVKLRIRSARVKVALAANAELISFYWDLGKMIIEKQSQTSWGDKLIEQVANNLKADFPDMTGLSTSNLKYCKRFYQFYHAQIGQQAVDQLQTTLVTQIPWGHNILIFTKSHDIKEANFYLQNTIENGWSRDVLGFQIKGNLYARQGKAIHNFKNTLPEPTSDLAGQLLKDPYKFDFLSMTEPYKERELLR